MKKWLLFLAFFTCFPAFSGASQWIENDYFFGADEFQKDSLTFFHNISTRVVAGLNAAFYNDDSAYKDKMYSFRLPLLYSSKKFFVSLTPFVYPKGKGDSGASGAKIYFMAPLQDEVDNNYLHLIFSSAYAGQETRINENGLLRNKEFSETSYEVQLEKSFEREFFFLFSASAFGKSGVNQSTLVNPALDHGDMAYMGAFGPLTMLPDWAVGAQFARNMEPDYNSYVYAGFSRISMRSAAGINSSILGIRLKLYESASLDMAYNFFKPDGSGNKNYYKLSLCIFF